MRCDRSPLLPALLCLALLGTALFTLAVPTAGAAEGSETPAPPDGFSLDGADLDNGKALFAKHCEVCHGATGAGDGKLSEHLNPNPGNLQERLEERSPWEVYVTTRDGGKAIGLSPVMVAFDERLSEQELKDVTAYTLELARSGD